MQQNSRYNAFSARQFFSRQRILRSEFREKTRQFLIGLFSKPVRIILTGFLHMQLQECTQTRVDIECWRKPVRIILIGIYLTMLEQGFSAQRAQSIIFNITTPL